jgi:hypothetical protein
MEGVLAEVVDAAMTDNAPTGGKKKANKTTKSNKRVKGGANGGAGGVSGGVGAGGMGGWGEGVQPHTQQLPFPGVAAAQQHAVAYTQAQGQLSTVLFSPWQPPLPP